MKRYWLFALAIALFSLAGCNMPWKIDKAQTEVKTWSVQTQKTDKVWVTEEKKQSQKDETLKWNWEKFIWFVATWCPHCQKAVPGLEKFYTKYSWDVNMEINVINKKAFPWVKNLPENYKDPKSYKDYTNQACGYVPSYVIVNKEGKVIEKKCWWSLTYEQLKSKLLTTNDKKILETNNEKKMADNKIVKIWDTVKVDYVWTFTDGKVFDTSIESIAKKAWKYNSARTYEPLSFKVWAGQMIKCFDKWVIGMKVDETKDISCQPEDAYGKCDPNKIQKVEKSKLKEFTDHGYKLEKWTELPTQDGMLKIISADQNTVTLDMNNPMCGKVLNFKITVKGIQK